jgi:hypothetical protein
MFSSSQINLSWTDTSSNEIGFKIERSTATAGWAQIGTVGVNVGSFASTGLAAGTTYSYRVRAYNTSGDSGYTNTAAATTQSGGAAWTKWYQGGGAFGDFGRSVAADSTGNVAVAGQFHGTVDFGTGPLTSSSSTVDAFVAKYSSSGTPVWSRSIGGTDGDAAFGVAAEPSGDVVLTGYQRSVSVDYGGGGLGTRGGNDIFVAKYSSTGGHVWSRTIGGTGADQGSAVAVDGFGNAYVTGYISAGTGVDFGGGAMTSAGGQDAFLVKYSSTGAHVWSKRFGSTLTELGTGVAVDGAGNVVIVGTADGTIDFGGGPLPSLGGRDLFVARFSAAGQHLWSKRFGSTGVDNGRGIAVDGAGDVFVTGEFVNSISFGGTALTSAGREDIFLAKLSGATGGHLWSKRFGNLYTTDMGYAVAVDGSDNVAITGYFGEDINFGGTTLWAQMYDIFVAKFDSNGTHISSKRYGDPPAVFSNQFGNSIAMSSAGTIFITGDFVGTLTFGSGGQATSGQFGGNDGYLARVDQ